MAKWLVLVYKLPSEPSAPRVAIWRALKQLEGRYLVDGAFATPQTQSNDQTLRKIAGDVRAYGGEALVLDVASVDNEGAMRPDAAEMPMPRSRRSTRAR